MSKNACPESVVAEPIEREAKGMAIKTSAERGWAELRLGEGGLPVAPGFPLVSVSWRVDPKGKKAWEVPPPDAPPVVEFSRGGVKAFEVHRALRVKMRRMRGRERHQGALTGHFRDFWDFWARTRSGLRRSRIDGAGW